MGGGLIQLAAYGSENQYLMGNPQITYFKIVHKHHTNFSLESTEIPFEGIHNLSDISTTPTTISVKIPRVGDLLNNVLLRVELPNIISSCYRQFRWVKNLGEVMVRSATLYIGGNRIETVTSEWLNIYHSLHLPADRKRLYDIMIGNTPDLYQVTTGKKWTDLLEDVLAGNDFSSKTMDKLTTQILKIVASSKLREENPGKNISQDQIEDEMDTTRSELPSFLEDFMSLIQGASRLQTAQSPYYDPKEVAQSGTPLVPSISRAHSLYTYTLLLY